MVREHRIGHPGHAVHGNDGDHTGDKHGRGAHLLRRLAERKHKEGGRNHEHLNDKSHRKAFRAEKRTQFLDSAEKSDHRDGKQENPQTAPLFLIEVDAD